MKAMGRVLTRYVASAAGVALILLALNLGVLIAFAAAEHSTSISGSEIRLIADGLQRQGEGYTLSAAARQALAARGAWAMLLDDDGDAIWSEGLPADLPRHYTVAQVATFSRWYLGDYPVYVWNHPGGLLVVGWPPHSVWKMGLELPEDVVGRVPAWALIAFVLNVAAAIVLALLLGFRLLRALRPIAGGIEDLSAGRPVRLATRGLLGDLAARLNGTAEELATQRAALARRDSARADWIAGISHDVRTPLSIVMGYADRLEGDPTLPGEARAQAGIIRRQSESIRALVNDLNLAVRLEYDRQPLRRAPYSPAELARTVVAGYLNSGLGVEHTIELVVDETARGVQAQGDAALLQRALANLIGNSIRHNPGGCAVAVRVETAEGGLAITVADNGRGFPPEMLVALADPAGDTDRLDRGTGLAIVQQIAQAHGGRAVFGNRPKGGGSAHLWLPL